MPILSLPFIVFPFCINFLGHYHSKVIKALCVWENKLFLLALKCYTRNFLSKKRKKISTSDLPILKFEPTPLEFIVFVSSLRRHLQNHGGVPLLLLWLLRFLKMIGVYHSYIKKTSNLTKSYYSYTQRAQVTEIRGEMLVSLWRVAQLFRTPLLVFNDLWNIFCQVSEWMGWNRRVGYVVSLPLNVWHFGKFGKV